MCRVPGLKRAERMAGLILVQCNELINAMTVEESSLNML